LQRPFHFRLVHFVLFFGASASAFFPSRNDGEPFWHPTFWLQFDQPPPLPSASFHSSFFWCSRPLVYARPGLFPVDFNRPPRRVVFLAFYPPVSSGSGNGPTSHAVFLALFHSLNRFPLTMAFSSRFSSYVTWSPPSLAVFSFFRRPLLLQGHLLPLADIFFPFGVPPLAEWASPPFVFLGGLLVPLLPPRAVFSTVLRFFRVAVRPFLRLFVFSPSSSRPQLSFLRAVALCGSRFLFTPFLGSLSTPWLFPFLFCGENRCHELFDVPCTFSTWPAPTLLFSFFSVSSHLNHPLFPRQAESDVFFGLAVLLGRRFCCFNSPFFPFSLRNSLTSPVSLGGAIVHSPFPMFWRGGCGTRGPDPEFPLLHLPGFSSPPVLPDHFFSGRAALFFLLLPPDLPCNQNVANLFLLCFTLRPPPFAGVRQRVPLLVFFLCGLGVSSPLRSIGELSVFFFAAISVGCTLRLPFGQSQFPPFSNFSGFFFFFCVLDV